MHCAARRNHYFSLVVEKPGGRLFTFELLSGYSRGMTKGPLRKIRAGACEISEVDDGEERRPVATFFGRAAHSIRKERE